MLFYKQHFLLNMNDAGIMLRAPEGFGLPGIWGVDKPAMEDIYGLSGAVSPLSTGKV